MAEPHQVLSETGTNALGYLGGGILALSLVPQIIKLVMTRSAEDISLMWSLLYFLGTSLSFLYLVLIGALAAWIPVVIEMCGCVITISLKIMYDHTAWGKQQQFLLEVELDKQDEVEAQQFVLESKTHKTLDMQPGQQPDIAAADDGAHQQEQQPAQADQPAPQQEASSPEGVATPQQQQQQPALQHAAQPRAATNKRVVINIPETACEADEAAAAHAAQQSAIEAGDVVLTVGVQLPSAIAARLGGPALDPSAMNSKAASTLNSPRSDAGPVVYGSSRSQRWRQGVSARKLPWYMTGGIGHNSAVPQSPRAAGGCRCPTCGQRCPPPESQQGSLTAANSRRGWSNAMFSPRSAATTANSTAATPRGAAAAVNVLSGLSRRLVKSLSRFGSNHSSRWADGASESPTPEAQSPRRVGPAIPAAAGHPRPLITADVGNSMVHTGDSRLSTAAVAATPRGATSRFVRFDSRAAAAHGGPPLAPAASTDGDMGAD